MVIPSVGPISTSIIEQEFQTPLNQIDMGANLSFSSNTYLPDPVISSSGNLKKFSDYKGKKKINDWAGGFINFDPVNAVTPYACVCTPDGRVVSAGIMNGTQALYNGDTSLSSVFTSSICQRNTGFFHVYDQTTGAALATTRIGTDTGSTEIRDGATNISSEVYVIGSYSGMLCANGLDQKYTALPSYQGSQDVFVAKLNSSAGIIGMARISSQGNADLGYGAATDSAGNLYVTGAYNGNGLRVSTFHVKDGDIFWNQGSFANTYATVGGNDVFLVKYSTEIGRAHV